MSEWRGGAAASRSRNRCSGRLQVLGALAALVWAAPAGAQGLGAVYEPALPIEITADTLEVFQRDQMAVFAGNVDAVQGQFVLSADLIRVHYRGEDDVVAEEEVAAAAPGGPVRRIEAEGNVVISSPEEHARGRRGVYDVDGGEVTLAGDVILTRGANVIRGEQLVVDLPTGRARVSGTTVGPEAPPEQRVRAVFVPGAGGE